MRETEKCLRALIVSLIVNNRNFMKLKHLYFCLLASLAAFACAQEPTDEPSLNNGTSDSVWGLVGCVSGNLWVRDVPLLEEGDWFVARGVQFTELTFKIRAHQRWTDKTNIGYAPGTIKGLINNRIPVVTSAYTKEHFDSEASDIRFHGKPGTYDVYFNYEHLEIYVMEEGFAPGEKRPLEPMGAPATELYIIGDACDCGWSIPDMDELANDNGIFTWTGNLRAGRTFRFPLQRITDDTGWWPCLVISEDGSEVNYTDGDNDATYHILPEDGVYTITLDLRDWMNRSISIERVGDMEWSFTVAGSLNGGWNTSAENARMIREGNYYVARNVPMQHGFSFWTDQPKMLTFRIVETGSMNGYGAADNKVHDANKGVSVRYGSNDNVTINAPEGLYDIYFDAANEKVWVMYTGYFPGQTPTNILVPSDFTIAGSLNGGWDLNASNALMFTEGKYHVARNVPLQHAHSIWSDQPELITIRIIKTGEWIDKAFTAADDTVHDGKGPIDVMWCGQDHITLDMEEGNYDVYFNEDELKVWVLPPGQKP